MFSAGKLRLGDVWKHERSKLKAQAKSSPSGFNNVIGLLRRMFDLAVEHGPRCGNLAADLKRVRIKAKELTLPGQDQFGALVAEVRRGAVRSLPLNFAHHARAGAEGFRFHAHVVHQADEEV